MSDLPNADETRREFLQTGVAATAAAALGGAATGQTRKPGEGIPTRPLGKTGVNVSILCLGGWHIGSVKDKDEAVKIMHAALDEGDDLLRQLLGLPRRRQRGDHGQGPSADGGKWRKKCFLMTKVCSRDAKDVRQQIEDSLKRLKTDVIDLMQMHEINWDNDPEWVVEKGGLAELLKIQKEGKVRFVGFTGHKSPHIHLKMLPVHKWDTVQMPDQRVRPLLPQLRAGTDPGGEEAGHRRHRHEEPRRRRGEDRQAGVCDRRGVHPLRAVAGRVVDRHAGWTRWTC